MRETVGVSFGFSWHRWTNCVFMAKMRGRRRQILWSPSSINMGRIHQMQYVFFSFRRWLSSRYSKPKRRRRRWYWQTYGRRTSEARKRKDVCVKRKAQLATSLVHRENTELNARNRWGKLWVFVTSMNKLCLYGKDERTPETNIMKSKFYKYGSNSSNAIYVFMWKNRCVNERNWHDFAW